MEVQELKRMVIAKPVASRPSITDFKSFSELVSSAINTASPSTISETAVAAIRPKTVRFKPAVNQDSVAAASSQANISGTAACSSATFSKPEDRSTVIYKPLAKLVSSRTAHLLANLENFDCNHQPGVEAQFQLQPPDQAKNYLQTQFNPNLHGKLSSQINSNQTRDDLLKISQNLEENQRASGGRPSYDGYNWRKYGQKQVKGSELPRSYYKCTYPKCLVKKKVERKINGELSEIIYKGEHNHSKPQPPKRHSSVAKDQSGQESGSLLWTSFLNEGSEGRVETEGLSENPSYVGTSQFPYLPVTTGVFNNAVGIPDNTCGFSEDCEEGSSRRVDMEDDEPKSKRRKNANESGMLGRRNLVQGSNDSENLGDGFRWRKYGQKVVKGNPYPRSYYRCTSINCNVRKHVERTSDDPTAFITTYEGKHNHDMPSAKNNHDDKA
ncbi:hypothetical protein GIB67_018528 [Kingdonia uniflora]|uniref:WRKY domain-containing protein n=1 Tax=Kingdonia uniflora TaxID=39325 RepID=A0A7J7LW74_9MAGN|nr:hypothetical protein GIB67_018528 [Kingdonia uniflora]